jgi:hypothetical protein
VAITPTDFKVRFPEFVTIADARIQIFLDLSVLEVGEGAWGTLYEEGVFLLAAHQLQLDLNRQAGSTTGGASVSNVESRSIGDVSVSFGSINSDSVSATWYNSTVYGQNYLRLKRRMGMGMVAVQ